MSERMDPLRFEVFERVYNQPLANLSREEMSELFHEARRAREAEVFWAHEACDRALERDKAQEQCAHAQAVVTVALEDADRAEKQREPLKAEVEGLRAIATEAQARNDEWNKVTTDALAEVESWRAEVERLREHIAFLEYEARGAMDALTLEPGARADVAHAAACVFRAWAAAGDALRGNPSWLERLGGTLRQQLMDRASVAALRDEPEGGGKP